MSTGRRGYRGAGDRGGRGSNRGNPFRGGANARGRFNGSDASTQDATPHAPRGGRGGSNARGDKPSFRGRGNQQNSHFNKFTPKPMSSSTTNSTMNSTPYPDHDYAKRLEYLRNERPRLREELIRRRLMNPDGPMNLADSVELHGICTDMCPEYERVRRIVENDYKAAECTPETAHGPRAGRIPDETRMVKAFTRSAAGQEEELVSDKRTPATCLKTLDYMFRRIDEDGLDFLYQWLWDRTRSVRKDMVGSIRPEDIPAYLTSVEQCARFHLVSLHAMAGSRSPNYDPGTDHGNDLEQLRNCFTSLRHRYDDNEQARTRNANKAEFVAYDLILSLSSRGNNTQLEDNPERCKEKYSHNRRVQAAYVIRQTGLAVMAKVAESFPTKKQNWANFWQAVNEEDVSFLMACAAEISFNQIRYHIMETLRLAYKPKKSGKPGPLNDWTPENLMHALGFDDYDQVKDFCGHYGLGFVMGDQGAEVLDMQAMPPNRFERPPELRPQYFSRDIVEPKRLGRSFLDVIQTNLKENDHEDGESLFVPQSSMNRNLNPNATPFKPPAISPFTSYMNNITQKSSPNASATQNGISSVTPGVFDPSKNSIKFSDNPFAKSASTVAPSTNFFSNNAALPSTSPTPTPKPATSNLFNTPSTATTQVPPQPASSPGFSFLPPSQPAQPVQSVQAAQPAQEDARQKADELSRKLEEDRRKAAEERRAKEEETRQARAAEEHRRAQEEQERQRLLQEEQERQRHIREEAERQAQAERQRQWEAEQLRRSKEEAEKYEREERARAYTGLTNSLLMDEDDGLLKQFLDHKIQNMIKEVGRELEEQRLKQWAEERYQQRRLVFARAVCARWWEQIQKKKKRAGARRRREKLKALRAGAVEEELAREEKATAPTNGVSKAFKKPDTPASVPRQNQSNVGDGGASVPRQKNPAVHNGSRSSRNAERVSPRTKANKEKEVAAERTTANVEDRRPNIVNNDYSETYYKSSAPIDRTETDWFKLRAMGVDPSEHRKRNFGSVSSDEEEPDVETKRARRSTSSTFRRSLPPRTDEELFARFRAIRDASNKTGASPRSAEGNRSTSIISQARDLLLGSPGPQRSRLGTPEYRRSASASGFANPPPQLSTFGRSIGAPPPGEAPAYKSRLSRFVPAHLYGKGGEAARAYREECRKRLSTNSPNYTSNSPSETPQIYSHMSTPAMADVEQGQAEPIEIEEDSEDLIVYSTSENEEEEPEQTFYGTYSQQRAFYGHDEEEMGETEDEDMDGEEENQGWNGYHQNEEDYDDDEEDDEEDYDDEEELEEERLAQQAQKPGGTQADAIELSDSD